MVYVNNRRRFFRRNFNDFRTFRKDKNNNYNIKNYQNSSSKNNNKNNRNFNNKYRNNNNKNKRNNTFNNRYNNRYNNKRYYNNNRRFNNRRQFNRGRYNNINKNTIHKVIKLLPKLINNNRNQENRPYGQNFQ